MRAHTHPHEHGSTPNLCRPVPSLTERCQMAVQALLQAAHRLRLRARARRDAWPRVLLSIDAGYGGAR